MPLILLMRESLSYGTLERVTYACVFEHIVWNEYVVQTKLKREDGDE